MFVSVPIITLVALFFLRTVPRAQIWKSYRVVAVNATHEETDVMHTLEEAGCREVISLSNQQNIPLSQSVFVGNDFLFSYTVSTVPKNSKYLLERENYFFDKNRNYKLYYVPYEYERQAVSAVNLLAKNGVLASVDSTVKFPWLSPIVCLIALAIQIFFSKRKYIFAVASVFPILLSWSLPFYTIATSVCLFLPAIFATCDILLYRKDNFIDLMKSPIAIMVVAAVLTSFATSVEAGFLFIICAVSSFCVISLVNVLRKEKQSFRFPTLIVPSSIMLKTEKKLRNVFLVSIVDIILLTVCFFFGSRFLPSSASASSIELPSKNSHTEQILPGLDDYTAWVWDSQTFPYKPLGGKTNPEIRDGDIVVFPRYSENGTMISERNDIMFIYDRKYKDQVIDAIDTIPYASVEKLLKAEGVYGNVGYSSGGETTDGRKTFILLISALFVTVCVIIFYEYYTRTASLWRTENE